MAQSAILQCGSLELIPFSDRFMTARYVSWLNDKETVRYSEQRYKTHSSDSCRLYAASFAGTPHYFWAIVYRGEHVGNITATVDPRNKVADLAILVGEAAYRGRGIGLEAWKCAMSFLLGAGGMRKVTAGTMAANAPMLGVMRAAGMMEEGRRKAQFLLDGNPVDLVMMAAFAA
jgi:RimJ/RimL family protein N-acetyltransferase